MNKTGKALHALAHELLKCNHFSDHHLINHCVCYMLNTFVSFFYLLAESYQVLASLDH